VTRDRFRVGGHARVTVWQYDADEQPDGDGRRPSDRLLCMASSEHDAKRIASAMIRAQVAVERANR